MSNKAAILDKLRNYEYEKCDCGGAVGDIYALIHHIADLDQAVTDAKRIGARGILEDFSTDDRIRLLLDAIGEVHTGTDTRYRLAWVVRIAYTWADLADPDLDALADIRSCAASLLETGPLEDPSIIHMAQSAGLVAGRIAHKALLREALVDLGAYALAWAAEIIAQEETGEGEDW